MCFAILPLYISLQLLLVVSSHHLHAHSTALTSLLPFARGFVQQMPLNYAKDNISLYAVPLSYGLALLPHFVMEVIYFNKLGKWQNVSPR